MIRQRNVYVLIQRNPQFPFRLRDDVVGYLDIFQREFCQQILKSGQNILVFHPEYLFDPALVARLATLFPKADPAAHHDDFPAIFIQSADYAVIYNSLDNQFLSPSENP